MELGQIATFDFTTHDPTTGQVSNADFLPTCEVYEDAGDTPVLTPVVTWRVGHIGDYRVTIDTGSLREDGSYNVIVIATVNTRTAKARIANFIISPPTSVTLEV